MSHINCLHYIYKVLFTIMERGLIIRDWKLPNLEEMFNPKQFPK